MGSLSDLSHLSPLNPPLHGEVGARPHTDDLPSTSAARHRRWCNVRRVLLVRLDGVPGVLASTAAFAAVRETLPWVHLTLLTAPSALALRHHLVGVDELIGFNASWEEEGAAALQGEDPALRGDAEMHLARRLRRSHFDAAILFTAPGASALPAALICRMAGLPLVLAHAHSRAHALLSDALFESDRSGEPSRPGSPQDRCRQLELVGHVGLHTQEERPRLKQYPKAQSAVRQCLQQAGLAPAQPYVLVCPGEGDPSTEAALALQRAALAQLEGAPSGTALVVCSATAAALDAWRALPVCAEAPSTVVLPSTQLSERAALLADARAVVTTDATMQALAQAVQTPLIDGHAMSAHLPNQALPWQMMPLPTSPRREGR